MPADRILECPFCGSSELLRIECESNEGEFYSCRVYCDTDDCNYYGPTGTSEEHFDVRNALKEAIEKWNRRTGTVYNGKTAEEWYSLYIRCCFEKHSS